MTEPGLEERLRGLLPHLVSDVDTPSLARTAWTRAGRVRRRRRVAAAAGAFTLVTAGIMTAVSGISTPAPTTAVPAAPTTAPTAPTTAPTAAPGPTAAGTVTRTPAPAADWSGPRLQVAPAPTDLDSLPSLDTPLAALSRVPDSAPALSDAPVSPVVAAVQRGDGPVLVLGPGGRWRRVDETPASPGPGLARLTSGSVSPDGHVLALYEADGIVLIDTTTGVDRYLPVTGPVSRAPWSGTWFPDGDRILVTGDAGTAVLSTTDGTMRVLEGREYLHLVRGGPGEPPTELSATQLVVHEVGAPAIVVPLATAGTPPLRDWYGVGHLDSGRVAMSGFTGGNRAQAVGMVEVATGRVTDLLQLSYDGRSQGCCPTLGWLDGDTVLLRDGAHLLAWRPLAAAAPLLRVADLPPGVTTVDVAPRGPSVPAG